MGKQPATGQKKTKEAISKAAAASSKASKKKWSKTKAKDKLQLAVFYDQATYDKLLSDVPKMKVISVSTVADKLKVNGSLARKGIKHLQAKGLIKVVSFHHSQYLYTPAKEYKPEKTEQAKPEGETLTKAQQRKQAREAAKA